MGSRSISFAAIHVERWAPARTYRLEPVITGDLTITDDEKGESMGRISVGQPAALPGATFRLLPAALDVGTIAIGVRTFEAAVADLEATLSVLRPNREAGIVVVRSESTDTQLVHQMPNQLARAFIVQRQQFQKTEATSTVEFLKEQIDTLTIRLAAAEEALVAFRKEGQVVSIAAEGAAQVTQLARIQASATRWTRNGRRSSTCSMRLVPRPPPSDRRKTPPSAC